MCTYNTFEKTPFKDLQPPEKPGLQYKCLVWILKISYGCILSNETIFFFKKKYFLNKELFPLFGDDIFYQQKIFKSLGLKSVICHIAPLVTNGIYVMC